jgi:hypothetical protein
MQPYLVHLGYSLMLCGFLARDILFLRGVLATAQVVLALYAFGISVPAITAWNGLLAAINAVWFAVILRERRQVHVPPDLQPIHRTHFAAMTAAEFLRWWRLGREVSLRDEPLTRDGAHPSFLYFIRAGTAQVRRGDVALTELGAGFFVGEMSLITGRPANADVNAAGEVQVHRWTREDLGQLRARDLGMWTKVQSAIGADLVQKIQRGDRRLAER